MQSSFSDDAYNLSALLRAGDRHAFKKVFQDYATRIYSFAYGYLKSKEDAEEIVQEVFFKLWDKRATLRDHSPVGNFLFTIAYNSTLNLLRKRKNGTKALAVQGNRTPRHHQHVEEEIIFLEYEEHAKVAISSLPPQRKHIFLLSREHHLSYKEIAQKLEISPKTVEVHINQALKDIRQYFVRLGIML